MKMKNKFAKRMPQAQHILTHSYGHSKGKQKQNNNHIPEQ